MKEELSEKDNDKNFNKSNKKNSYKVLKVVAISTSIPSLFLGVLYWFWYLYKQSIITNFLLIFMSGFFLISVIILMVSYVLKK